MARFILGITTSRWFSAICFLSFVTLACSTLPTAEAHENHVDTGEAIERFYLQLEVRKDATMLVTETIDYEFGEEERHGIYRDIPVDYVTKAGNRQSIALKVKSVTDREGNDRPYETSREGANIRLKIGDPDKTVTGLHTYTITYETAFVYGYFESYDEIYWNVTGNGWEFPIKRSAVEINLPESVAPENLQASCYVGPEGSATSCDQFSAKRPGKYVVSYPKRLEAHEGITVALGFPKGLIREPAPWERFLSFVLDNPLVALPLPVIIALYFWWYRHGRDPKGRGVIIPEYASPDGLSALEVAGLTEYKVTGEHISAGIIELAVTGLITIRQIETKKLLIFTDEDYVFHRTNKAAEDPITKALLTGLFGSADPEAAEVKLSDLKQKFYTHIPKIEEKVFQSLVRRKYFLKSPREVWGKYVLFGVLGAFAAIFLISFLAPSPANFFGLIISFVCYFICVVFMPSVTKEGAHAKERVLGLKDYLQIAEKNRLEFHNAPAKRPELFEKLLPAAMILGVSAIWAKEFEDIYTTAPEWYSSPAGRPFTAGVFASDMGSFQGAASGTLASAPGGSSGSGGGGSSGGGGGGGGGGSW